jgi:hypothetical protein
MIPKILTDDHRETLRLLWRDPGMWADAANRHWMCAEALYEKALVANERWNKHLLEQMQRLSAGTGTHGTRTVEPEEQRLLEEAIGFIDEDFLLLGYAVECGLKGCLIGAQPSLISDHAKNPDGLDVDDSVLTHDLQELGNACAFTFSADEAKLLEALTYQTKHGKYPGPRRVGDIPDQIRDLFGQRAIATELLTRIGAMLQSLIPAY